MFDIIIENADIVDGSGKTSYKADIGIKGKVIETIGDLKGTEAVRRINARGRTVCPGFIDAHSHADLALFKNDFEDILSPLVKQGITTFVGGHCGMGLAPLTDENSYGLKAYLEVFTQMDYDNDIKWNDAGSFMEFVEKRGLLTNMALLVPHGILRISASGINNRLLAKSEIEYMKNQLINSMEAGCFGLSSGLQYAPGLNSDTEELVELSTPLARYDGIHASHLRSYTASTMPQAVGELGEISRRCGIHTHSAHIFSVPWAGPFHNMALKGLKWLARNAELATKVIPKAVLDMEMNRILGLFENERKKGGNVTLDIMPTTAGFTHLLAFFPPWTLVGGKNDILEKITDKETRAIIKRDIEVGKPVWPHRGRNSWSMNFMRLMGWDAVTIMAVGSEKNKNLEGRRFTEIGEERGVDPFDVMCDLLIEEDGHVLVFESMSEPDDIFTESYTYPALVDPSVMITTDTILLGIGKPSYLFYGCYPKFIGRYVFEKGLLDLETAVYKCTGLPAKEFGIENRGLIKEGYFADLLVMDAQNFKTKAVFRDPVHHPTGLDLVMINGRVVVENGDLEKGVLSGMMLRKQDQTVSKSDI
jgi:N-acyl-D-aspartate/D-glutamate deacylase